MLALKNGLPFPCVVTSPRIVILAVMSDQGLYILAAYSPYIDQWNVTQREHQHHCHLWSMKFISVVLDLLFVSSMYTFNDDTLKNYVAVRGTSTSLSAQL